MDRKQFEALDSQGKIEVMRAMRQLAVNNHLTGIDGRYTPEALECMITYDKYIADIMESESETKKTYEDSIEATYPYESKVCE